MPKKDKGSKVEAKDSKTKAAPIVIKETEEDLVFDAGFVNSENFKEDVKKEAEKGDVSKFVIAALVFLVIGGGTAFATWYYARPEKTVPDTDKIQTPPIAAPSTEANTNAETAPTPAPAPEKKETTYTVKEGDTMSSIANANNMTSTELAAYNGIADPNTLHIGQTLKIPVK